MNIELQARILYKERNNEPLTQEEKDYIRATSPPRNMEMEKKILSRLANDEKLGISSYGGMGLSCVGDEARDELLQEIGYMAKHKTFLKTR